MSFHAQMSHRDGTLALNGKTITGHGPTHVTRAEAEHLRTTAAGVIVTEVEGGPEEPETEPVPEITDERRQHELRERRGEFEPKFDHGHTSDPESDPYRERREIQHRHAPEHAAEQAEHQAETRLATKNQRAHKPVLADVDDGEPEQRPEEPREHPTPDPDDGKAHGKNSHLASAAHRTATDLEDLSEAAKEEKPHRGSAKNAHELDHPHSLQTDRSVKGLLDEESQTKKNPSGKK